MKSVAKINSKTQTAREADHNLTMAYFSGYSQMVNLDQLYETLSVPEGSMGGMAFIIEQMLNRAMLDLDVEQQEFLFFIANTLKEAKSKIRNICPDGSGPRFELVKLMKE